MHNLKAAEKVFSLIPLLEKKFVRPLEQQFKPVLSPIQVHVLSSLQGKKHTMTELSREMLMSKQQMTPIIDKLVSQGFAQREYDSADRRIIQISITAAGLEFLAALKEKIFIILEEKLAYLEEQDVIRLSNAITALQDLLLKIP